jgi:hypothetical protein
MVIGPVVVVVVQALEANMVLKPQVAGAETAELDCHMIYQVFLNIMLVVVVVVMTKIEMILDQLA